MTLIRPVGDDTVKKTDLNIEWMRVERDLWVGRSRGEFAGMIESRGTQFAAIRLSQLIGTYDSLSEAKRSFS